MDKCDVIITYCWNRVGYNILRSLAQHGLRVFTCDTSKWNICSLSKYCSGSFVYPDFKTDEKGFITCLLQHIDELRPKVLLPTHDESIVIMRHRDKFPKSLIIPYQDSSTLLKLADKKISSLLAKAAGIPIPNIYASPQDISKYPVVFKTVIGNSAKGVYFPKDYNELQKCIETHGNQEYLIEEWIGGSDFSIDCIRWNGFWACSGYKAIVTKTEGGGTTTQRETVRIPLLEKYAKAFLDYVDYQGVCGIDFRFDVNNYAAAYIETNARFTGGIATTIHSGFDIPWIIYSLATTGKFDEIITIKEGTRTKWILGDIITLVGRLINRKCDPEELKRIFSFRGFTAFDDFYNDDKKAILGEFLYYSCKLIKNRKLNP